MAETNGSLKASSTATTRPPTSDLPRGPYSAATLAIHADDRLNSYISTDVAPPLRLSTTYHYPSDPSSLVPYSEQDSDRLEDDYATQPYVYTRYSHPNATRLETILQSVIGGNVLTYTSGLTAFHAMLVYYRPNVIAVGEGYHGVHAIISILTRLYGLQKVSLLDQTSWDEAGLGKGDIIHVETPVNPTGEAISLEYYRQKATERGAILTCDATFAPPPLQDPFKHGVDVIMHSGTKYIGGHSDLLCGVLATRDKEAWRGLFRDRASMGGVMGSLEGWLGVRSVRTLEMRIERQSANAERLVGWLGNALQGKDDGEERRVVQAAVVEVRHASLQKDDVAWLKKQMPNGYGPVFAIYMKSREIAKRLPSKLKLFNHATSLGGVESLIEWRKMSDSKIDDRVVRFSIGIENWKDLRDDLLAGFKALLEE